jgi:hypothetical protein
MPNAPVYINNCRINAISNTEFLLTLPRFIRGCAMRCSKIKNNTATTIPAPHNVYPRMDSPSSALPAIRRNTEMMMVEAPIQSKLSWGFFQLDSKLNRISKKDSINGTKVT